MLRIECPWCGDRDETEFTFGGQAHIQRPSSPEKATDAEWAEYLFYRDNPKGEHHERWVHSYGCRQWFNLTRDTVTHEILHVYAMKELKSEPGKSTLEEQE
jgi:sarcosine oxidase subunit delta